MSFEQSFGDFLDRREYDRAEDALFSMVRIAFSAGWLAAGGEPPQPQPVLTLQRPHKEIINLPCSIETDIPLNPQEEPAL